MLLCFLGQGPFFTPIPHIHLQRQKCGGVALCPLVRSKCGWDVVSGPTATPTLNFRALGSSQSSSFLKTTKAF